LPVLTIRIAIRALDGNSGADGDGQGAPLAAGIGADGGVIALIASFLVINAYLSRDISSQRRPHGSSRHRRRTQPGDVRQDLPEHPSRYGNLGHLERYIAAVADHPRADPDQLLPERGQRPVLRFL